MYAYVNISEITDDVRFEDLTLDLFNKILFRTQKTEDDDKAKMVLMYMDILIKKI